MPDEFYGDEIFLIFHETPSFFIFVMLTKLMIFNDLKFSMKLSLKLA